MKRTFILSRHNNFLSKQAMAKGVIFSNRLAFVSPWSRALLSIEPVSRQLFVTCHDCSPMYLCSFLCSGVIHIIEPVTVDLFMRILIDK